MNKIFKILFMVVAMVVVLKLVKKTKADEEKAQQDAAKAKAAETPDSVIIDAAQAAANDLKGWKALNSSAYEPAMKLNNETDWIRFRKRYRLLDKAGWEWSYRYKHQGNAWNKSTRLQQMKAEFDRREAWA